MSSLRDQLKTNQNVFKLQMQYLPDAQKLTLWWYVGISEVVSLLGGLIGHYCSTLSPPQDTERSIQSPERATAHWWSVKVAICEWKRWRGKWMWEKQRYKCLDMSLTQYTVHLQPIWDKPTNGSQSPALCTAVKFKFTVASSVFFRSDMNKHKTVQDTLSACLCSLKHCWRNFQTVHPANTKISSKTKLFKLLVAPVRSPSKAC